jgi:predicted Zn-dependent protease
MWRCDMPPDGPPRDQSEIIAAATELHRAGHHRDAEAILTQAIGAFPASHALRNACGVMQAIQGRHTEAAASYRRALSLDASASAPAGNGRRLSRPGACAGAG